MLLVIGIIGLLAGIALVNFSAIRQSNQLSLVTDQIENLINNTRSGGRFGKETINYKDKDRSTCWGLTFSNSSQSTIEQFIAPYLRGSNECIISEKQIKPNTIFAENERITINKINTGNTVTIISKPPNGKIEIYNGSEQIKTSPEIKITLNLDQKIFRTISINALTGETSITPSNQDEN